MAHRLSALLLFTLLLAAPLPLSADSSCGTVVTVPTHGSSTTRYALTLSPGFSRTTLVLLPGGGGYLNLSDNGCPRALTGNSLVRSRSLFHDLGFATALVDAPSDYIGDDGLAGFRSDDRHAEDLGRIIADVRRRTKGAVWLVGTSRGTISAVNAGTFLTGPSAPDGLILTSLLMVGTRDGRKAWTAQSVFDFPLESLRLPVLLVGHAADGCFRSPARLMADVAARMTGSRHEVVTISGGTQPRETIGAEACEGRSPHGYLGQEAEVAAAMARFIRSTMQSP